MLQVVEMWGCELDKLLREDMEMKEFFDKHKAVSQLDPRKAFFGKYSVIFVHMLIFSSLQEEERTP